MAHIIVSSLTARFALPLQESRLDRAKRHKLLAI